MSGGSGVNNIKDNNNSHNFDHDNNDDIEDIDEAGSQRDDEASDFRHSSDNDQRESDDQNAAEIADVIACENGPRRAPKLSALRACSNATFSKQLIMTRLTSLLHNRLDQRDSQFATRGHA